MVNKADIIIGITLGILVLLFILGVAFFISPPDDALFSPPGVDYSGNDIQTSYSAGEKIKGTVNLTFSAAPAEYELTSNFEGNISLLDFLEANNLMDGDEYNCSTSDCSADYVAQNEITSLTVDGDGEIAGFSISGDNVFPINSVKLTISSSVGESCPAQLFIDVLNDGQSLIINNQDSGEICPAEFVGCFNAGDSTGDAIITEDRYCEKITLPATPGLEIGARVKNSTSGTSELSMLLYDLDVNLLGQCVLPEHTQGGGIYEELRCFVEYGAPLQNEYFICVTTDTDATNYKIKFETADPICGTKNFGVLDTDYDIFVQSREFGFILGLETDQSFMETYSTELKDYVQSYIDDKYDRDCSPSCAIPIRFFGQNQNLQFSNIQLEYVAQQGTLEVNIFYNLEIEPVTLTSELLVLDLEEAEFTIPFGSSQNKLKFYINGELVFQEDIDIAESFDFDVNPKFVSFGQNALFKAETNNNITTSTWDFGDGTEGSVSGKHINHRYLEEGEFEMEITLERSDGVLSTKIFNILVGDAEEIANSTIIDYRERITNLGGNINLFPTWIANELNSQLDLAGWNASLNAIEDDYDSASSDEDFQDVMLALIDLRIPQKINVSKRGTSLPLLVGFDNLDISYIEDLSGGSVGNDEDLKSSIAAWMSEKYDSRISFEHVAVFYDDETEVILSKFKIDTSPRESLDDTPYLIIGHDVEEEGKFMTDYSQNVIGGDGTYIILGTGQTNQVFEFFILGEFDPEELGSYISPEIARLGDFDEDFSPCNFNDICEEDLGENANNCEADCGKTRWGWFIFLIIALLFIALVIYIVLQEWYKRNYEKSLFENRNDLYNLINFIYNARKSGLRDGETKNKLKESGWKGEQIRYAFRKIDGQRTGMYEIPVFKHLENKKVKKELARRQHGRPVDPRFVGRTF